MQDLVQGNLGAVGGYDLKIEDGKLKLELSLSAADMAAKALDYIAEKIPGHLEDGLVALLKEELKKL